MLTKEEAAQRVALLGDGDIAALADRVTGHHDDADVLATAAALERSKRTQAAQQAAEQQRIADRDRDIAKSAYESIGLKVADDPEAFNRWYAARQRQAASEALDNARIAAGSSYRRSF